MAEWDLTPVLAQYLDPHFVYGLLEFLGSQDIYDPEEIFQHKVKILSKIQLIDALIALYEKHERPVPEELNNKLEESNELRKKFIEDLSDVLETLASLNDLDEKQLQESIQEIRKKYPRETIDKLYEFAKYSFTRGQYQEALAFIKSYQLLIGNDDANYEHTLWGSFVSSFFSQDMKEAQDIFFALKNYIENANFSPMQALQNRTWLIHWGLFIFFNVEHGRDYLVDLFLDAKNAKQSQNNAYLNAIQTSCPHILRYLTAAVITHRQRRIYMKELVRLIQQESYNYRDPITEFVECLYVNFDFDGAQQKLRDCEVVLRIDFFLTSCIDEFIENARLFIFEIFCQIHECISIEMIADKLNMSSDEAERWIVKLIRDAHFDARIDSKHGHVIMGTQAVSQYHQLIEKTQQMRYRTEMLTVNVEKIAHKKPIDRSIWN
ncbi:eukaryotic translation initiation factor 3 subunit e [Dermatophagoides pteronyssinus]|uniref:Eukaryotic translation initiation factor 3 subunit E n=3 Tax=Pyroglyphidae TaxID=6952 RepID=A0ABQ8JAH5_DERPT|nr:eukaryotic translation initiation factor 3 subunit E-like [Dermatophagoides pteronyssinus]KAH9419569.1 Eukaryotic translation initiation factor 3 subunit E [Dermatophagoides pteronyssinus]